MRCEHLEPRRLLSAANPSVFVDAPAARSDINIDSDWKFNKSDVAGASDVSFDDGSWSDVSLPHTWNAQDGQDGGDNYYRGIGWYRKHLTPDSSLAGDELFLKFDGATLKSEVFVNGVSIGTHNGGYAAFTFDVTPYLTVGQDNVVAVKVDNSRDTTIAPISGDFTVFGGLYRDVHLLAMSPVHVNPLDYGSPGVFITQKNVSQASADLTITSEIRNDSATSDDVTVDATILDADGKVVQEIASPLTIDAGTTMNVVENTTLASPHLWNGKSDPYMYSVVVQVSDASGICDQITQPLGLRYFSVDPNTGFFLNGQAYDLHGVDLHQDHQDKGDAITLADRQQDIDLLNDIGATAVRLAHEQHGEQTYDLLDENGIVTWTEIPLWGDIKDTQAFTDNTIQQLRELIRQNYNHPSIFFWGLYNELSDTTATNNLIAQLDEVAHEEDPTRLTTAASNQKTPAALDDKTDVLGFNRYFGWYYDTPADLGPFMDGRHATIPDVPMAMSEFGAGANINQHTNAPAKPVPTTIDFHPEEYQAVVAEGNWEQIASRDYLWGKFVWQLADSGSDGRAEGGAPGINDKGLVTYDRQMKKDAYYYYKANWNSTDKFVYITDRRYTTRSDATTTVKIYSNLDSVELFVNGVSQGVHTGSADHIFTWTDVILSTGTNNISATATDGTHTASDSCIWTLPASLIAGVVYDDINGNGVRDAGEAGVPGVTVYNDSENDGALDPDDIRTTTDATGAYVLHLPAGSYKIREVLQTGWMQTTPANGFGWTLSLSSDEQQTAKDFGTREVGASISGTVFNDVNGNGTLDSDEPGVGAITLYNDANNNGAKDAGEITTTSAADGSYLFAGLSAGSYKIREILPAGWTQTTPANNFGQTISLSDNQAATGKNFGQHLPGGAITGAVYNDANQNLTRDGGEAGIAGITMYNDANNNHTLDSDEITTTTDANGIYRFLGLSAGSYKIRAILPSGFFQTTPTRNFGQTLTLAANQVLSGKDFGFAQQPLTVTDEEFSLATIPPTLRFTFSDDIDPTTLSAGDLVLTDLTTSETIDTTSMLMVYDPSTRSATWSVPAPLADGNYRAALKAGTVASNDGATLSADATLDFSMLAGDADGNGVVGTSDFLILAQNFGRSSASFAQGDFNFDGVVNALDFNILATHIGEKLAS